MDTTYKLSPELEAKIPHPPAICIPCLENKLNTKLLLRAPGVIATYCSHSFTGAACNLNDPRPLWLAWSPMSREAWDEMLAGAAADLIAKLSRLN